MTTILPKIPPQTMADLASLGTTFFVNGIVIVIPREAYARDIFEAISTLDRLALERSVAEASDCGGT